MKINYAISFMLSFIMIISMLTGCERAINSTITYKLQENNGEFVIRLSNVPKADSSNANICEDPFIQFESLLDMKTSIADNLLTQDELSKMCRVFPKDEDGNVPIVNINNVQKPIVPSNLVLENRVDWYGKYYVISFDSPDYFSNSGYYKYYPKNRYDADVAQVYSMENQHIFSEEWTEERNATVITASTGVSKIKYIRYCLTSVDGSELRISEEYTLETETDFPCSDTVPCRVYIHGKKGDQYFVYVIRYPDARPTVEWLSSFGIQELQAEN